MSDLIARRQHPRRRFLARERFRRRRPAPRRLKSIDRVVLSIVTADQYDIQGIATFYTNRDQRGHLEADVFHMTYSPPGWATTSSDTADDSAVSEIFFFEYGVCILWGHAQSIPETLNRIFTDLQRPCAENSHRITGFEMFEANLGPLVNTGPPEDGIDQVGSESDEEPEAIGVMPGASAPLSPETQIPFLLDESLRKRFLIEPEKSYFSYVGDVIVDDAGLLGLSPAMPDELEDSRRHFSPDSNNLSITGVDDGAEGPPPRRVSADDLGMAFSIPDSHIGTDTDAGHDLRRRHLALEAAYGAAYGTDTDGGEARGADADVEGPLSPTPIPGAAGSLPDRVALSDGRQSAREAHHHHADEGTSSGVRHRRFRVPEALANRIRHDHIVLGDMSWQLKLAFSHGLAQSLKLSVFEERIDSVIEHTRAFPVELAQKGSVSLSLQQIAKIKGHLFVQRMNINLYSDILDEPDYFWENVAVVTHYERCRKYYDIEPRVKVLNLRLAVVNDLFGMLGDQLNQAHANKLELIVIFLIVVEVVVGLAQIMVSVVLHALAKTDQQS